MTRPAPSTALLVLIGAAAASLAAALAIGSVDVSWSELAGAITRGHASPAGTDIVLGLRAPRALSAFAVGALQALLRNPLADPYVLGISGGAAFAALLALAAGLGAAGVQVAAVGGALATL